MVYSIIEFIDHILYIFISNFQRSCITLLACNVNSGSLSLNNNILWFSPENPDNEGSPSNLGNRRDPHEGSGPDNNEDSATSSNSNQENPNNSNLNENNNEGSNSNSNGDSNSDHHDSENNSPAPEEINDLEYNGPERIIDDLEILDKARKNDPEALEYLSREYGEFFEGTSKKEGLKNLEGYLEDEFPAEYKRSELEADAIEAKEKAENLEKRASQLEKEAEETTDPQKKEDLAENIELLRDKAAEEREKAEKAESASKSFVKDSSDEDSTSDEGDEKENNKSKRPMSEEQEEKKIKRQKSNNDGEDGNNSSSGGTPSGPSEPGPSGSSGSGGGNLSKVLIILGGLFETLSQVIENFMNIM